MATSLTASLAEVLAYGGRNANPISLGIIKETIYQDTFLWSSLFPTKGIDGIINSYRRESTRPKVKTHNVGGTICESYATFHPVNDQIGRAIVQIPVDLKVLTSNNQTDFWGDQFLAASYEFSDYMQNNIINGTGDTDGEVIGLKKLVTGFGAGQKFVPSASTTGAAVQLLDLDRLASLVRYPRKFFLTHPNIAIDIKALGMAQGGNSWKDIMVKYAAPGTEGYVTFDERPVQAYNGIPIFESEWLGTETTYGGSAKYRILCGSFAPGKGLEFIYPNSFGGRPASLGFQIDPRHTKENHDEDFIRARWSFGISCYSTRSLAQAVNYKFTNA